MGPGMRKVIIIFILISIMPLLEGSSELFSTLRRDYLKTSHVRGVLAARFPEGPALPLSPDSASQILIVNSEEFLSRLTTYAEYRSSLLLKAECEQMLSMLKGESPKIILSFRLLQKLRELGLETQAQFLSNYFSEWKKVGSVFKPYYRSRPYSQNPKRGPGLVGGTFHFYNYKDAVYTFTYGQSQYPFHNQNHALKKSSAYHDIKVQQPTFQDDEEQYLKYRFTTDTISSVASLTKLVTVINCPHTLGISENFLNLFFI